MVNMSQSVPQSTVEVPSTITKDFEIQKKIEDKWAVLPCVPYLCRALLMQQHYMKKAISSLFIILSTGPISLLNSRSTTTATAEQGGWVSE